MKHAESNGPSLAELAAEANRRRHRFPEGNDMDTSQAGSLKNAPWWAQVGVQFGFGAVIALMLVIWLQTTVEKKIDAAVVASQEAVATSRDVLTAQAAANLKMGAFAAEQTRQNEIMLLVQRQTCANTAKSDPARDGCYATK